MATLSILIFFTFIYTAFSAKIVLFLQLSTNKINDVGSVYAAGFDFAVEDQPFNQYYFKGPSDRAEEQLRKQIYEKKIRRSHGDQFVSAEKGIQLVRDTFCAFHVERTVAHYLVDKTFSNNQKCSLRFVRSIFKSDMPYLSIPWNSSYIKYFIISFRRLAETGLQDRECKRCYAKKPSCEGKANTFVSVGLIEAYFPFLIFGVGIWLCISVLILEKLAHKYMKVD